MEKQVKKAELLAPAGNREAFLGAVHAGADAVYLGGERFGARAYADNFSREELIACIRYGHIHGCRTYLTVNTLMKEQELAELAEELAPLYEVGLDGVIVQDLGALQVIRQYFPGLALHASTQMTVTGPAGAELLKELGVTRVVPARELSLAEICQLRQESGLEVETFIHGAMCYCYSGACLFSSILGGRSGNRGRCAQPCRLAYETDSPGASVHRKEYYPLSLKDMCTIEHLPQLMESGIDSFKIEGRMKKPEYAAGVTAIYRKYMDRYLAHPQEPFSVEKQDLEKLSWLYIRSRRQNGYYFRQNGREMVTLDSPSYSGSDEAYLEQIRQKYIEEKKRLPVWMKAVFVCGRPAQLQIGHGSCQVNVTGSMVEPAQNRPVAREEIRKQLQKLGETSFALERLEIETDEKGFYSLKEINGLRREAVRMLEDRIIEANGLIVCRSRVQAHFSEPSEKQPIDQKNRIGSALRLQISTEEQLLSLAEYLGNRQAEGPAGRSAKEPQEMPVERLYAESHLLLKAYDQAECRQKNRAGADDGELRQALQQLQEAGTEVWMALPYVLRSKDRQLMQRALEWYRQGRIRGFLVRNLEEYGWLQNRARELSAQDIHGKEHCSGDSLLQQIQLDHTVYVWNSRAAAFWRHKGCGLTCPLELNGRECQQLLAHTGADGTEKLVYGRIPMMVTANCIAKTAGKCLQGRSDHAAGMLTDRYRKKFPVEICCDVCLNVIYNSVPLSLHKEWAHCRAAAGRLAFTTESGQELVRILDFFRKQAVGEASGPPYEEYTTGHEKRGVL